MNLQTSYQCLYFVFLERGDESIISSIYILLMLQKISKI